MPELPEVQTTVNGVNRYVAGLSITDVWTDYRSAFHADKDDIKDPAYFARFRRGVKGTKIVRASRRGKNVLMHLSNGKTVLIHMKMTGHIMYGPYMKLPRKDAQGESWRPEGRGTPLHDPFNRFIHLVFSLSNGKHLVLSDMRKFAKTTLIDTDRIDASPHIAKHGPEPLDASFTSTKLRDRCLRRPKGPIKAVLMDHTIVSGIGNIYSDEILWRSGINPLERVEDIPAKMWPTIFKALKETLRRGIDFGGDSMSDYRNILGERGAFQEKHRAYRRTGKRCSKRGCPGIIRRIVVGGRSAHFCDAHQRLRRKLI